MRSAAHSSILLAGLPLLAVLLVLASIKEANAQLCPLCQCPPAFAPVCAKRTDDDGKIRVRGFPSLCVMECMNQCRKNRYSVLKPGRCGTKMKTVPGRQNENEVIGKRYGDESVTMKSDALVRKKNATVA